MMRLDAPPVDAKAFKEGAADLTLEFEAWFGFEGGQQESQTVFVFGLRLMYFKCF